MQLAGRLRSTTLGDVLGTLYRGNANGTLELVEDRGRTHRVHLTRGLIIAVELDGASPSLAEILREDGAACDDVLRRSLLRALASSRLHGEVLIGEFQLSPAVVGNALRRQVLARLSVIDRIADARLSFRVVVRPPRSALSGGVADPSREPPWNAPLDPREFLPGRRRTRPRGPPPAAARAPAASAWDVLGVPPGAPAVELKRAYRSLARSTHPDRHPDATADERRALEIRFVAITDAYKALIA